MPGHPVPEIIEEPHLRPQHPGQVSAELLTTGMRKQIGGQWVETHTTVEQERGKKEKKIRFDNWPWAAGKG